MILYNFGNIWYLEFKESYITSGISTIMFIIFWDFLMAEGISFHLKWNEAWRVASRVAERLKT